MNVYGCNDGISDFHGKKIQDNQNSIVNTTDLTLKQTFGISAKVVGEQDEISNLERIGWEEHSWKYLSLICDERVNARRSTSFQILYCVLGRSNKILNLTKHGRKDYDGLQHLKATETMMESVESRVNSSGTSSQDSIRCSSMEKSQIY